uniref:UPF0667 family protein C31G5.18c n=1 Tax=Anthurium amnicola TaxID=1678845 RepID=A0A1D1XJC8_9ARAE
MAATLFPIEPVNSFSSFQFEDRLSNKDASNEKPEKQYRSVIINLFSDKKTICLVYPTDAHITVFDIKQVVYKRLLLEPKYQCFYTSGKLLNDNASIFENKNDEFVNINLRIRILGGKGGFGSMLRAQGGKMASQKTTNFEACRDLNGRRLRTVNEARRLADHLEQEPERQRAQREKVKRKIEEGLREPPTKKYRFDDTAYLKASEEMKEKVQNTVAEALQKPDNKNDASIGSSKSAIVSLSMWDVEISDYDSAGSGEEDDTEVEDDLEETTSKKKEKGKGKIVRNLK